MPLRQQALIRYVQLLTTAYSCFGLVVTGGHGCEVYRDRILVIFTAALVGSVGADAIKYAHNKGFCASATLRRCDATHGAATKP